MKPVKPPKRLSVNNTPAEPQIVDIKESQDFVGAVPVEETIVDESTQPATADIAEVLSQITVSSEKDGTVDPQYLGVAGSSSVPEIATQQTSKPPKPTALVKPPKPNPKSSSTTSYESTNAAVDSSVVIPAPPLISSSVVIPAPPLISSSVSEASPPSPGVAEDMSNSTRETASMLSENLQFTATIMEEVLNKMNREGNFEKNNFVLTSEALIYSKIPLMANANNAAVGQGRNSMITYTVNFSPPPTPTVGDNDRTNDQCMTAGISSVNATAGENNGHIPPSRIMPLTTLVALPLAEEDTPGRAEKRNRTFKVLAKEKSFFLRAPTVESKEAWLEAITIAARNYQMKESGKLYTVAEAAPIWVANESNCQICGKDFNFFIRRHHCRNCGKCVCEVCSKEKMRIPSIDERKLFKVCGPCSKELKQSRSYGV